MQVLIAGADDFIGRQVALALARCDWATPIALAARANGGLANLKRFRADSVGTAALADALQGVDAVVNSLAGSPKLIAAGADALFTAAARLRQPPLIVHVSSMTVYGSTRGDVSEDAPLLGDLGPYSAAKVQAEAFASRYPRTVILRPGCEYGPEGELWSGRVARWLFARRLGDLGAAGDGYCNLAYIDDLVAAVLLCLRRPDAIGSTFNLAMRDPPTWNEYLVRYARALGAVPVRRISARRLALETRLLAAPLKAIEIATRAAGLGRASSAPPIPPSLLRLTGQEIRLVAIRAERMLGWTCRPLDQGLADTAAWFNRSNARGRMSTYAHGL